MNRYVEKYRPSSFTSVIGQSHIVNSLQQIVTRYLQHHEQPPHLLFIGPPGTGKTTLAVCFARALFGPSYQIYFNEYNASDTRKIDDIREKIKPLSRSVTTQIIFFDEADGITFDSQQALRRIMEKSPNTIFILSANTEQKLTEAIRSRCTPFHFQPLTNSDIGTMLKRVLETEQIKLKKSPEESRALYQIIKSSKGDLRKALNLLETIVTPEKELNLAPILETPIDQMEEAINTALSGNDTKAKDLIEDIYLKNSNDVDKIIDSIYNSVLLIPDVEVRNRILYELGDLEHRIQYSHRPLYQLVAFIIFVWKAPNLQK